MKREEKAAKKIQRARNRRKKRKEKYIQKIQTIRELGYGIPLSVVDRNGYVSGSWRDPSSPTGWSQKCSYERYGTCQSPCNGDC